MTEDAKFLKRKIRGGSIDVHPTEKALVVHYETEATILGELGNPVIGDRKESQKIIRVKNLNENTDIPELAKKIVENCKLISEAKLPQVEHLLKYLLKRKETSTGKGKSNNISEKLADPGAFDSTETDEVAHLTDLDDYLELLYEDIPEKLRASALVLQLARNPDNLEELFQNETLVGALARVLREDWKKSTDLATNITYIFFCFSSFSNFHGVILHFKIGALTMTIIEHELQKYNLWIEELERKKQIAGLYSHEHDQIVGENSRLVNNNEAVKNYEISLGKFKSLVNKQEQLFRVSFYLLLNISEDLSVEVKMHNKGIINMMCRCLSRDNFELLILLVSFLKKLSIFSENKNEMINNKVIEKLGLLLARPEEDLVNITLRLLFNLSFDTQARIEMISKGILDKIVNLLDNEQHRPIALYILYHLSIEDQSKKAFVKTKCLQFLMKTMLENPCSKSDLVLMALAINLACEPTCAVLMLGEGKCLKSLIKRALKYRDSLIMKLLRNVSFNNHETKLKLVDYLPDLVKIVIDGNVAESDTKVKYKRNLLNDYDGFQSILHGVQNKKKSQQFALIKNHKQNSLRLFNSYHNGKHNNNDHSNSSKNIDSSFDNNNGDNDDDNDDNIIISQSNHFGFDSDDNNGDSDNNNDDDSDDDLIDAGQENENDFNPKDEDFILECLACLANLNLNDIDYNKVLGEFKLLDWIKICLDNSERNNLTKSISVLNSSNTVPDRIISTISGRKSYPLQTEDDVLLEIIRLISSICQDSSAALQIIEAGIVQKLITILNAKQEDDEIVCQIVHVFYQLVYHEDTRSLLIETTQATAYLVDLMHDKNSEIRRVCDIALDIVSEFDANWGMRIQAERFRWHNSQWLEMIESSLNPTLLNYNTTNDTALAAALGLRHARAQNSTNLMIGDNLNRLNSLDNSDSDENELNDPFGMGMGIDDATAFLLSLPTNNSTRKNSSNNEYSVGMNFEENDYLNQLEILYPEIYGDTNFLMNDRLSPALTDTSQFNSDSDRTPRDGDKQLERGINKYDFETCNGNRKNRSVRNTFKLKK